MTRAADDATAKAYAEQIVAGLMASLRPPFNRRGDEVPMEAIDEFAASIPDDVRGAIVHLNTLRFDREIVRPGEPSARGIVRALKELGWIEDPERPLWFIKPLA